MGRAGFCIASATLHISLNGFHICALNLIWQSKWGRVGLELVRQNHSPEEHYRAVAALYEAMSNAKTSKAIPIRAREGAIQEKPKLRVAFIGARGVIGRYSGIEGYYEEVGSRLARAGHDVTVYCRSYFTPQREKHNGMRLVRLPTIRSKHLETVVHTLLSSIHVMTQPCEIVHFHALGPSLFSMLPRIVGKKTVVSSVGYVNRRGSVAPAIVGLESLRYHHRFVGQAYSRPFSQPQDFGRNWSPLFSLPIEARFAIPELDSLCNAREPRSIVCFS